MIDVSGVQPTMPPKSVGPVGPVNTVSPSPEIVEPTDVVEISSIAKLAARIHELPDVRTEMVARVKTEIAAGTYETSERLDITIDRLMEELFLGL